MIQQHSKSSKARLSSLKTKSPENTQMRGVRLLGESSTSDAKTHRI